MPMYEYQCNQCQECFEALIRNPNDEKELVCPKCQGKYVSKKFSVFGMKSSGKFVSSSGSGCSSCSSHNCHSCGCGGH